MTGDKVPGHLGTLAVASAEAANFEQAIRCEEKALESPNYVHSSGATDREQIKLIRQRNTTGTTRPRDPISGDPDGMTTP